MVARLKKTAFGLTENATNVQKYMCDELCAMIADTEESNNRTTEVIVTNILEQTSSLWQHFDIKVAQVIKVIIPSVMVKLMLSQYLEMLHYEKIKNQLEF